MVFVFIILHTEFLLISKYSVIMSDKDTTLESGSDTSSERRDYPGMSGISLRRNALLTDCSKMVPLNFLQHDHFGSLQLQRTWYLGSYELPWCRRSAIASSSERG